MTYSIYSKKINNIEDIIETQWLLIGKDLSSNSVMSIMDEITDNLEDPDDYVFTILPDVFESDIVFNKKTNSYGIITHIDYPDSEMKFITVELLERLEDNSWKSMNEVLNWNINDIIVMEEGEFFNYEYRGIKGASGSEFTGC